MGRLTDEQLLAELKDRKLVPYSEEDAAAIEEILQTDDYVEEHRSPEEKLSSTLRSAIVGERPGQQGGDR